MGGAPPLLARPRVKRVSFAAAVLSALLTVAAANGAPQTPALTASVEIAPQSFLFGQAVHIRIDAIVDHSRLDPRRVHLEARWSPYTPIAALSFARSDAGTYSRLTWRVDLHCVSLDCVPRIGSNVRNVFQPATVRYVPGPNDRRSAPPVTITWPNVIAWSRLDPIDSERKAVVRTRGTVIQRQNTAFVPPWHVDTNVGAVSYGVRPAVLLSLSIAVALALLAAAFVLVRPWFPAFAFGRRAEPSKLDRALAALERARGQTAEERKALELLAVELRSSGEDVLAWAASELAWSPEKPEPERTGALAATVRETVAGRTNGHRGA